MTPFLQTRVADLGSWTINGANTVAFAPGVPIRAKRLILRYTTGNTTNTNGVTVQRRPVAGVASNQVSLFTFETTQTTAAGDLDVAFLGVPRVAGTAHDSQNGGIGQELAFAADDENLPVIYPGQDIAFVSDGDGTAGVCNAYLEYLELPWNTEQIEDQDIDVATLTVAAA